MEEYIVTIGLRSILFVHVHFSLSHIVLRWLLELIILLLLLSNWVDLSEEICLLLG